MVRMPFCSFSHCFSLREVAPAMLGLKAKTKHFQLKSIPYRSALSDVNKRPSHEVSKDIYYGLTKHFS